MRIFALQVSLCEEIDVYCWAKTFRLMDLSDRCWLRNRFGYFVTEIDISIQFSGSERSKQTSLVSFYIKCFAQNKEKRKKKNIKRKEKIYTKFSAVLYFVNKPACLKLIANPPKYFVCCGFKKIAINPEKNI